MISHEISRWCHGSPVHRYGLYALQWIVEVNGKPTPDLDAFVDVTKVCLPWLYSRHTLELVFIYLLFIIFIFFVEVSAIDSCNS